MDESKRVRTQPEHYILAVGCQLSTGSIHLSRVLPAKHLNDTNTSPMGGTLTCSPLVFCFCLSCNSWNVFPLGNSKMLLRIRKKTPPPAPPSKIQFSCETSLLPHQAGGWKVASAIRRLLTSQNYFCGGKNICSCFLFCFCFINRLPLPPTGLRRVAALPAPGDS